MPHSFKLSRRIARFRAPVFTAFILTLVACNSTDSLNPDASSPATTAELNSPGTDTLGVVDQAAETGVSALPLSLASVSYVGGIPIGPSALPSSQFGSLYNGTLGNIFPDGLLAYLAAVKARGGKVILTFSGNERNYKDASGHFSLTKWKARIDRYKYVNFNSYINDGTIVGHYLIDEPQDASNWNGTRISPATVEAMAKYSKDRWPNLVTIVRTWPDYLDDYSGTYRYLDAAWAQYTAKRFPNMSTFLSTNVNKAKAKGLALVVGLNLIDGSPTGGNMTGSQIKTYGAALLSSTYPCAFISWQYRSTYLSTASIKDAMSYLKSKAANRSTKTCRGA
jgi:hypothetical protein